ESCEVLGMVVHQLADAEEELRATRQRDRAPARERALGRLDGRGALLDPPAARDPRVGRRDGRVDLLDAREVDLPALLAGRRVVDGAAAAGRPLNPLAVDPVRDPGYLARTLLGELIRNLRHAGLPSLGRPD